MATGQPKLKLGKGTAFVKTHLKQLRQHDDTWEVDFRALPRAMGEETTHYLGLVVALSQGNPLVCLSLDYTPTVNDLADLLAGAMRRPITDSPHRPRQLLLRENPRWEELFAHLKQLDIEVSIQNELPRLEDVYEAFLLQMRRARSDPLILYTPQPLEIGMAFPAIAQWVRSFGRIEIGSQKKHGFIVRALNDTGSVFEDDKSVRLAEAMAALEEGLAKWFQERKIEVI